MQIQNNISLKPYNTFGIDAKASHFIEVDSKDTLVKTLQLKGYPKTFVIGGGSNMLLTQDLEALVLHINIKGIEIIEEDDSNVYIKANAGEVWHDFVLWCIDKGFGGIENLSLIPGNVGTAPIQNIGAYGVELKDVFVSCEAVHIETQEFKTFEKGACKFGYRNSIFKNDVAGQYIITSVTFKLTKTNHKLNTSYGAILSELEKENIKTPTIKDVSNTVVKIRKSKLPDPKEIGNSGSFFKNPIIPKALFEALQENFSDIPFYEVAVNEIKIPAGWLIEKSGFKGKRFGNYGVHNRQALVLVNYGGAHGRDILNLSKLIQKTVQRIFGITLETEVNII